MEGFFGEEFWRTIRYALASNARTARCATLMLIILIPIGIMF